MIFVVIMEKLKYILFFTYFAHFILKKCKVFLTFNNSQFIFVCLLYISLWNYLAILSLSLSCSSSVSVCLSVCLCICLPASLSRCLSLWSLTITISLSQSFLYFFLLISSFSILSLSLSQSLSLSSTPFCLSFMTVSNYFSSLSFSVTLLLFNKLLSLSL